MGDVKQVVDQPEICLAKEIANVESEGNALLKFVAKTKCQP
jgi:hypothetical protein